MQLDTSGHDRPQLPVHEWLAVISILILMLMLTGLIWWTEPSSPHIKHAPHYILTQEIDIYIEGAVEKPGKYRLKRGATFQEILNLASPSKDADLRRIKINKKLRQGQVIKIPTIPYITVYLEGEISNPGKISVPKGSKLKDLIPLVQFNEGANIKKLQKQRRLKDNEVIKIVKKNTHAR